MEAGPKRRPIVEDGAERAVVQRLANHRLWDVHQAPAVPDCRNPHVSLVYDEPTRHVHLHLLLASLELPSIDAVVADPDADAAVGVQVIGMHGNARALQVSG